MKKLYKINRFTAEQWDAIEYDWNEHDDEIVIIEKKDAYCMDITANGKRIVPILRKIEKAMTAAGLAGEDGIYAGWFGEWADELTNSYSDRKNFIWDYSGRSDRERGCWSYSWGIEQIDEDRWYIFLNIAKPQEETKEESAKAPETAEKPETKEQPTEATEAAPLFLETLAAKLDRMDAAETARTWARNGLAWYDGESGTIDAATDDAIWHALRNYREQFHAWNAAPTPINDAHQTGRTPEIIAAIEAEDVRNLFKAYGVTA